MRRRRGEIPPLIVSCGNVVSERDRACVFSTISFALYAYTAECWREFRISIGLGVSRYIKKNKNRHCGMKIECNIPVDILNNWCAPVAAHSVVRYRLTKRTDAVCTIIIVISRFLVCRSATENLASCVPPSPKNRSATV